MFWVKIIDTCWSYVAFPAVVGKVEFVQSAGSRQVRFRRTLRASSYSRVTAGTKIPVAKRLPATRSTIRPIAAPICFEGEELVRGEPVQSSLVPQYGQKLLESCSSPWQTGHFIQDHLWSWVP